MRKTKKHGWLVGALQKAGYQQRDLARAWGVDEAVVSRFIRTGRPDLTPQRQMLLAQILRLTNDQLLLRLYGQVRRIIPLCPDIPHDNDNAPSQQPKGRRRTKVTNWDGPIL